MKTEREIFDIIVEQEETLVFEKISKEALIDIGNDIVNRISSMKKGAYVMVNINNNEIFSYSMPSASPDSRQWALRKGYVVNRMWKSSFRVKLQMLLTGRNFEDRGIDKREYALEGGAFPVKVSQDITIGYIAVSGMASEEDHQVIADAIASHLNKTIPSVL